MSGMLVGHSPEAVVAAVVVAAADSVRSWSPSD